MKTPITTAIPAIIINHSLASNMDSDSVLSNDAGVADKEQSFEADLLRMQIIYLLAIVGLLVFRFWA
jgi:hypothetical protein